MASTDSTRYSFRQRLLAVLDYDCIPQRKRVAHVASACGFSLSTARRLLTVERNAGAMNSLWLLNLEDGLKVNFLWLYNGNFERFDPRTARIYLSQFRQQTAVEIDAIVMPLLEGVEGEPDYLPVGYRLSPEIVIAFEQTRRMTEWERNKWFRFCLRLLNDDKKALRLSEMCIRKQITRTQFFSMM